MQPPRPKRRWLPWVIGIGILTVGGCGALLGTVGVHFYKEIDGAKTAVDQYFMALERGDLVAAQSLVCDEAGPSEAERAAESHVVLHHIGIVHVHQQRNFGSDARVRKSASATVDVTLAGGVRHRDVIDVEYEHDRWLVCGVVHSQVRD